MDFMKATNDFAFKRLFGNQSHKDILISFLNSVLELSETDKIVETTIIDPNNLPDIPGEKNGIVDVRCRDNQGREYIVEMRARSQERARIC